MTERYTTWGPVRGTCGTIHQSIRTAQACIERDHRGCQQQGGYSDRRVFELHEGCVPSDIRRIRGYGIENYGGGTPVTEEQE